MPEHAYRTTGHGPHHRAHVHRHPEPVDEGLARFWRERGYLRWSHVHAIIEAGDPTHTPARRLADYVRRLRAAS